jgi:hypothetical protein
MNPPAIPADLLASLRPEHPRVLATAADFDTLQTQAAADPVLRGVLDRVRQTCDRMLTEPVVKYHIPDGKRLLLVSRQTVERTYHLGLMARLTGQARYRDGLWANLEAAAAFPDWNPSHFLDTAEMGHALAVGYDWLYDQWTDAQRRTLREAIVRHGLEPGLAAYRGEQPAFWPKANNNWNEVCNGGLATAALALGLEIPQISREVLGHALASLPVSLRHFAPDGGWPEGPGYWGYTLRYLTALLSTLEAALGSDLGLGDLPGLSATGMFPIHLRGPTGRIFNFCDAAEPIQAGQRSQDGVGIAMWLARRYRRQDVLWGIEPTKVSHPLAALWWSDPGQAPMPARDACFRGVECVTLRSRWDDPDGWFVAMQCGRNIVGHKQADLGTFVMEALGERWAIDLGPDDYNLPEFFGGKRFTYYRLRAEGHNVIVAGPDASAGQDLQAGGTITRFDADPTYPQAEADLTPAYPNLTKLTRRIALPGRSSVLIEDTLESAGDLPVWWFMHTRATIAPDADGRGATLEQGGRRLRAVLESPTEGRLSVMDARPLPTSPDPEGQNPNNGAVPINVAEESRVRVGTLPVYGPPKPGLAVRKLALHLPATRRAVIRLRFTAAT